VGSSQPCEVGSSNASVLRANLWFFSSGFTSFISLMVDKVIPRLWVTLRYVVCLATHQHTLWSEHSRAGSSVRVSTYLQHSDMGVVRIFLTHAATNAAACKGCGQKFMRGDTKYVITHTAASSTLPLIGQSVVCAIRLPLTHWLHAACLVLRSFIVESFESSPLSARRAHRGLGCSSLTLSLSLTVSKTWCISESSESTA
jgi:hypothetical protein